MYGIVIVEDEELERQALRSILTGHLPDVRILGEARTGAEAISLIDTRDIDLMLVDINIPKPNGLDVIRHLRERRSGARVIITTAYDYFEIARSAIHLRADDYLLKPIRTETLLQTVRGCLDQLAVRRDGGQAASSPSEVPPDGGEAATPAHGTLQKALRYIGDHLNEGVTLEEVADHSGISACYLSRLFKKTLNVNFVSYVTSRRMELARKLLRDTSLSVSTIAAELSFSDVNYFCKSFRKEVGRSPSEYRRRERPVPDGASDPDDRPFP